MTLILAALIIAKAIVDFIFGVVGAWVSLRWVSRRLGLPYLLPLTALLMTFFVMDIAHIFANH